MIVSKDDFQAQTVATFANLHSDHDFTDVTLATEDGGHIQAHRVVLSQASQVLRSLLVRSDHPHPLVYLQGVGSKELEQVLRFVYLGQVEVANADLGGFVMVGTSLKVEGIMEEVVDRVPVREGGTGEDNNLRGKNTSYIAETIATQDTEETVTKQDSVETGETDNASNNKLDHLETGESDGIDYRENTELLNYQRRNTVKEETLEVIQSIEKQQRVKGKIKQCDLCEKSYHTVPALQVHKEAVHDGIKYKCDLCPYEATTKSSLEFQHKRVKHGGLRNKCDMCDYETTTIGNVNEHKKKKHTELLLYCKLCPYKTLRKNKLNNHINNYHENSIFNNETSPTFPSMRENDKLRRSITTYIPETIAKQESEEPFSVEGVNVSNNKLDSISNNETSPTFPCTLCKTVFNYDGALKLHIEDSHQGKKHKCFQCNFLAGDKSTLKKHIQDVHAEYLKAFLSKAHKF